MISAGIENELRKAIYRRDGYRCALCDSTKGIQIHHYLPRGKGGKNAAHNLITLCANCHGQIHGMKIFEDMTAEDLEQAVVEYLADMYAPDWNPYKKE